MEWYKANKCLPNDGERVLAIKSDECDKKLRMDICTFTTQREGALTYFVFTDIEGNDYLHDEIIYWTSIENIPNDITL